MTRIRHPEFGKPNFKPAKADKPARKGLRRVSQKRAEYQASPEGKEAMEWMRRVKELPCVICGKSGPSDAHHVFHGRYGTAKPSGFNTIPLCKPHHQDGPEAIHNGKATWAEKHGYDFTFLPQIAVQLGEIDF